MTDIKRGGRSRRGSAAASLRRSEAGMVTAEAALVLPVLVLFTLGLVFLASIGIAEVRVVDAARDAAREIARGTDTESAIAAAQATAPDGAVVDVDASGGQVAVTVRALVDPPAWLLVPLPSVGVESHSIMAGESDAPAG